MRERGPHDIVYNRACMNFRVSLHFFEMYCIEHKILTIGKENIYIAN